MLLRNFLYLDTTALDGYVSQTEDGLRTKYEEGTSREGSVGGGIGPDALNVRGGKTTGGDTREERTDTSEARFARFMEWTNTADESAGWIEVVDPATDLQEVGYGAMVHAEVDLYIPDVVKALHSGGEFEQALDMLKVIAPIAPALGWDTEGLPTAEEQDLMRRAVGAMGTKDVLVVGEFDDADWKLAGQLSHQHVRVAHAAFDGPTRIVGKVKQQLAVGEWRPMLALPGTNLMPREQRRAIAKQTPTTENPESTHLQGPALMLDVLAIYR